MMDDKQALLTTLRQQLNIANTLNCNVHRYQGDFLIDADVALARTSAANDLYMAHMTTNVRPLFVQLGKLLTKEGVNLAYSSEARSDEESYLLSAERWYQAHFLTGLMW